MVDKQYYKKRFKKTSFEDLDNQYKYVTNKIKFYATLQGLILAELKSRFKP